MAAMCYSWHIWLEVAEKEEEEDMLFAPNGQFQNAIVLKLSFIY